MDQPSTSFDFLEDELGDHSTATPQRDLVAVSDEYSVDNYDKAADSLPELLGFIEAQIEFCDQLLYLIEIKRKELSERKACLEKKMKEDRRKDCLQKNRVPVIQYLPPYFKDDHMMCPPQNEEAKHKLRYNTYDPLTKEDKKWSPAELRLLRDSVKNSVIQASVQKYVDRKEMLNNKIARAGIDIPYEEVEDWREEVKALNRKIEYSRAGQVDSQELDVVGYSCVDWLKISTVEFKGTRSADTLKYKWLNEQCPRWNSGPWTKEELEQLRDLREGKSFTSWAALAKKLGTGRTSYQCFEKYRSDMFRENKHWTKEEDDRLVALVKILTVNEAIPWDKVSFYMPGRHRQQVRTRYLHTLDENVRHGRWSENEDLLLMTAVARFGAKDWAKVAKCVVGRSDSQCRERWCNVLDRCTDSNEWTAEEDERLVFCVQTFGRGQWAKIGEILPRHKPEAIRRRYHNLLATKMRLCSAKLVGYPVLCKRSTTAVAIHKAKRDVLREQLTGGGLKEFFRAAKEQAEKNPSARITSTRQCNKFNDEEKARLQKGIEEISKKFKDGEHTSSVTDVIRKIDLTKHEVAAVLAAVKKTTHDFRPERKYRRRSTGSRMIRRNMYLLSDISNERTVFRQEETEEERIICLTNALCHAVRKYDQYEWCKEFFASRHHPESVVSSFVTRVLCNQSVDVANCLKKCVQLPQGATLDPTFTTVSAYRVFEKARSSLMQRASCCFCPSSVDTMDTLMMSNDEVLRNPSVYDRLNIQLHPDILRDDIYLRVKAQVRCIFLEPTRLALAIDPPDVEQERNKAQMRLMQAIMDEQAFPYDESGIELDVGNEVVVSSTEQEQCGPIDYEDYADDALTETVNSVVQEVCYPPPERKKQKKRGRPTRKDKLLASLDVSNEELNASKTRNLPFRSAKKSRLELADESSSDDYDMEMDSESRGDLSSLASQNSQAFMGNRKTSLNEGVSQATTEQGHSNTDPPKRKRGRPKKTVAVDSMQEVRETQLQSKRKRALRRKE
ncbi:hypothetical protein KIN20_031245 [Parelaphostrongylus tenuis]|uniref:snRNA-activating protein complex subunit 4 n=1 Tax=Parelaphostrongylus tenuis TaxID=148309 RepID=A0AAD5R535_PARTN|nr:hypothetical protein KIN20_031245 [Parelaphostrongylus tenuis]